MHKSLTALAVFCVTSSPAMAQTARAPIPEAEAAPAKPKMVKKTVCQRIIDEETTGSRLGTAPKVCKTVEVPAGGSGKNDRAPAANPDERG